MQRSSLRQCIIWAFSRPDFSNFLLLSTYIHSRRADLEGLKLTTYSIDCSVHALEEDVCCNSKKSVNISWVYSSMIETMHDVSNFDCKTCFFIKLCMRYREGSWEEWWAHSYRPILHRYNRLLHKLDKRQVAKDFVNIQCMLVVSQTARALRTFPRHNAHP